MVHTFGVAETGPVHRAMCPMFEGGESFWLQSQRAITNPYFGAMMFTCGEIVETISGDDDPHGGH
jgi:membrane fusion protein, copper/silver efflux system